jgi:hypothetical protein
VHINTCCCCWRAINVWYACICMSPDSCSCCPAPKLPAPPSSVASPLFACPPPAPAALGSLPDTEGKPMLPTSGIAPNAASKLRSIPAPACERASGQRDGVREVQGKVSDHATHVAVATASRPPAAPQHHTHAHTLQADLRKGLALAGRRQTSSFIALALFEQRAHASIGAQAQQSTQPAVCIHDAYHVVRIAAAAGCTAASGGLALFGGPRHGVGFDYCVLACRRVARRSSQIVRDSAGKGRERARALASERGKRSSPPSSP